MTQKRYTLLGLFWLWKSGFSALYILVINVEVKTIYAYITKCKIDKFIAL